MIPWKFRVDKVLEINKALFHIEKTQLIFFYQLKHVLFNELFFFGKSLYNSREELTSTDSVYSL